LKCNSLHILSKQDLQVRVQNLAVHCPNCSNWGVRLSYHANQGLHQGQVVLPGPLHRRLDIRAGDPLDANIENGRIALTPQRKRPHRVKIVKDPVTGLPALSAGPDTPTLSSKEVEEILGQFSMIYLLDVNALVALGFINHEFHSRVAHWVRANNSPQLASCSITELGFLRVLAQPTGSPCPRRVLCCCA
jgi:bifunctional DNA-binding transcriptional regulator/antitoxin component of YhaV-PrlF toxin-antitoxin module